MRIAPLAIAVATLAGAAQADSYRPKLDTLYTFAGLDVLESINDYTHEKGDSGAAIEYVHVYVRNTDGKPHAVRVDKVELLHAHCNTQKWAERSALPRKGDLEVYTWDDNDPAATGKDSVAVPAAKDMYSIEAHFKRIRAYNECDRFAFGLSLEVDGKAQDIELEMNITRHESCPSK